MQILLTARARRRTLRLVSFQHIDTARLTLRAPVLADADDLAARRSDPSTARYQGWDLPYTRDEAMAACSRWVALGGPTPGEWFQIMVVERSSARTAGDLGVHLSADARTALIGYTLSTWARGQGYATEAAAALCTHLVRNIGVQRVEATTDPRNTPSIRVLERLGFQASSLGEAGSDDLRYVLMARDWRDR
jgi:[ribosomal protein S5]-alanine N-acetyltransferase